MALTVIGGSSFVGRYLIKSLSTSYPEVRLGDMYPYRQSVYRLQEELKGKITKHPLAYPTNLRNILEGTQDLIIVTHDYFRLSFSKNFYLEKAVQFAKDFGVKKIIWVGPIELDHLSKWDGNPEELVKNTEMKAREIFPELMSLRTNLLFGPNCTSLVIQKTLEDLSTGKSILTNNHGSTRFSPVHEEDFFNAFKALKPGDSNAVSGPEELLWSEIVNILATHCGVSKPSHSGIGNWLKAWLATCEYTGDITYPSHLQQLYRLLAKTRAFDANVTGTKKISDFYEPGKFTGLQPLNWHRVILD